MSMFSFGRKPAAPVNNTEGTELQTRNPVEIDIPLYVLPGKNGEKAKMFLSNTFKKTALDKEKDKETIDEIIKNDKRIDKNTKSEDITSFVNNAMPVEYKSFVNEAYNNTESVIREQGTLGKVLSVTTGFQNKGILSGIAKVGDVISRNLSDPSPNDIRLALDEARNKYNKEEFPSDYELLYVKARDQPNLWTENKWKTTTVTAVVKPIRKFLNDDGTDKFQTEDTNVEVNRTLENIWKDYLATDTPSSSISLYKPETLRKNAVEALDTFLSSNTKLDPEYKTILYKIRNAINEKKDYKGNFSYAMSFGRTSGFNYEEEIHKGAMSKFRKLVNNIGSFSIFTVSTGDSMGKVIPRLKGNVKATMLSDGYTPEIFEKRLLTEDLQFTKLSGGRRTRKHKKSKTQKGGRRNKKTRKH